jgi:Zn-dependent oligopeptidase
MDTIKKLIKLTFNQLKEKINFLIEKSREMRIKIISKPLDNNDKIKLLVDDTFIFHIITMVVQIQILKTDGTDYDYFLKQLTDYNIEFNTDIKLLNAIIILYKNTGNDDDKFFLLKLIKSMEKYGTCNNDHEKILEIFKYNEETEDLINTILNKPTQIRIDRKNIDAKSESIMTEVYPDKKNNIYIDKNRYYYLIKKISDVNIRNYIENEYIQRYSKLMTALDRLLISRKLYSKLLGYESFYEFVSNKSEEETENIKVMLQDLNDNIDSQLEGSLQEIKDLIHIDKLKLSDIIYALDRLYPNIKFKPIDIIQLVINVIQNKLKIKFKQSSTPSPLPYANLIEIYNLNNNLKGYLFLDLLNNQSRKVSQPMLIKLSPQFGSNLPVLYLTAPFTDLDKSICNLSDVVNIFREFGMIIQHIFATTPQGQNETEIETMNFMPDLMEFILFNKSILELLIPDKNIVKKILHVRQFEFLINLKLKCISVLFDNIIHSSNEFTQILKKSENKNVLTDLYKKIYGELFIKFPTSIDLENVNIAPNVIYNMINGQQGLIFGNLISNILAFNAAIYIMENRKLELLFEFLDNKNYSYKKNLIKFIASIDEDYYKVFLAKCLKIKNIHIESYFDVETQVE